MGERVTLEERKLKGQSGQSGNERRPGRREAKTGSLAEGQLAQALDIRNVASTSRVKQ